MIKGFAISFVPALLGAVALWAIGLNLYAERRMEQMQRGWDMVSVAAAARPLKQGETIAPGALVARNLAKQASPSAILAADREKLTGRVLAIDLPAGSTIRETDFETNPPDPLRACIREARK